MDEWMDGGMPVLSKDEMRYLRYNLTEYNIIILENTTSVSGHSLPIAFVSDWHGDFL